MLAFLKWLFGVRLKPVVTVFLVNDGKARVRLTSWNGEPIEDDLVAYVKQRMQPPHTSMMLPKGVMIEVENL